MNLKEAFQYQIQHTRLLTEKDLSASADVVVWNGVIFRPEGNYYTSGREMQVDDKFIIGYIVHNTRKPTPILIEVSELDMYDEKVNLIRVVDNIPILEYKDKSDDHYNITID
jgi:Trm5-related predicted tRNA methylase